MSGDTNNKFSLDPLSGDLKVAKSLDRETVDTYTLVVHAIDYGSTALTGTATVSVTVTDANDNTPVCGASIYPGTVIENSSAGTSVGVTVVCTDSDDGVNGQVQYAITAGNTGTAFAIGTTSGVVTVATAASVDIETSEVMTLTVVATDQGSPALSASVIVAITLTDVNENSPVFVPSSTYSANVNENSAAGSTVSDIDATDADIGPNGEVTYAITAGNSGSLFWIDPVTGVVSLQNQLDRESADTHALTVEASDKASPSFTSTGTLSVTVDDYNDNAPVCPDTGFSGNVDEDSATGVAIVTVACTDADSDALNIQMQYTITAGDPSSQFSLDINTGVLTVGSALDYETSTIHHVTVQVNDLGTPSLSSTTQVSVLINPVNEHDPSITVPGGGYTASVDEDDALSTTVITITATDADDGIHGDIRYSITVGNSQSKFSIGTTSGIIIVAGELDREATSSYTLTVRATDSLPANGDERYDETSVVITILDINDNYPTFSPAVYVISILEGAPIGSTVKALTITDDDDSTNAMCDLSIISGDPGGDFTLIGNDIVTAAPLDNELTPLYDLRIQVMDRGTPALSSTAQVVINILSENEHAPVFDGTSDTVTVDEDLPVGTLIYDGNATDTDANVGGDLKYYIIDGDASGVTFLMDPDTGKIVLGNYLDYDTATQSYTLTIHVYDNSGDTPYLNDTMVLTVNLQDVNDNTPTFTQNTYSQNINEDIGDGVSVDTVTADDIDSTVNSAVVYTIESGDGGSEFTIDSSTGVVSTATPQNLDRDTKDTYTLMIKAADQGTPVRSSYCIVKITLDDVNDNDPNLNPGDFTVAIDENEAPGTFVTAVYATDADIGNNALIIFSLNSTTNTNGHFSITKISATTANIYTTDILDRETIAQYVLHLHT